MPDGDLVFVSYSHKDGAWAQRFTVLLKPLLRKRRIRLWVDGTALRGGDEWRREIEAAIAQSAAALILVSGDYLDSDFVADEELPALVRHGVRLLPVLVGDCLWPEEPTLAHLQWLHDLTDGALSRDAGDPSLVDKRLTAMCWKLLEVLPATSAAEPEPVAKPGPSEVAEVPVGPSAGALSGVQDDPPGYVVRDELAALIEAVAATDTGGAVGVTAAPFGLVGQGGIGKSVLAAALGRDRRMRHRFPDGVFWVTVGERPDVLAVQLDLLSRLGDAGAAPRSIHDATARLREVLRQRRVLLLVDDVWSDAAAYAFRVTGPQGRVVYTARERQVVAAVAAREYPIGALSADAARAVAAAVIGRPVDELPATADQAFNRVGRVALAVALLAAAVRGGRSWHSVADQLRREVDVYGDHPYANTFKAMQIGVAALPAGLATALLGLAVFPPDTAVPLAAVARYWVHTRGPDVDTSADLDRLAAANLLRRDGDDVGFHDLQHDYLLLHSEGLPTLHADLLDAYRSLLPDGGRDEWWRLPPDEPYIWNHLVAHLAGAGERKALAETATDAAYLARRIDGGGLHAAEADLVRAGKALPAHRLVAWWQRWLARHAPFLAGAVAATTGSVSPTMLAWLQADPTRSAEVDPDRLGPVLPSPYLAARWGLASPEPALVRALTGSSGALQAVDWSADGTLVVAGSRWGEVHLWDPDTGKEVARSRIGELDIVKVAWSADGRHVAMLKPSVHVYDAHARTVRSSLDAGYAVSDVAWSPDGRLLAVVDGLTGGALRLWALSGAAADPLVVDHPHGFAGVAWSGDGCRLATADRLGAVEIWDAVARRRTGDRRNLPAPVNALSWRPRSHSVAVAAAGRIHLWQPATDTLVVLGEHPDLRAIAWSPDGTRLASGGRDVRVWDPGGGPPVRLGSHTDVVGALAWSPDGTLLATAGGDREVQIWDTAAPGSEAATEPASAWVRAIAVSRDGDAVATLDGRHRTASVLRVRDVAVGPVATASVQAGGDDKALAWSPDGRHLHVAGRTVRRWARAGGRLTTGEVGTEPGTGWVEVCAWATGARRLAVAGGGEIRVWGQRSHTPTTIRHFGAVTDLSWSADGTRLAASGFTAGGSGDSGTEDSEAEVVVWEIAEDRQPPRRRRLVRPWSAALSWSPRTSWLAVAVPQESLLLWEPATGATTTLPGRLGQVTDVVWSPDGRHVITAGEDGAVAVHPVDGTPGSSLQLAGANCVAWEGPTIAVGQRTGPAVLELRVP